MPSNENKTSENVESPCVRNCCLNNDDICLGCFRHLNEITGWQRKSNEEKQEILQYCEVRKNNHTR